MTPAVQRPSRALLAALVAAAVVLTGCLVAAGDSKAARKMELGLQDDAVFLQQNPRWGLDRAFDYARPLGITRMRVNLLWAYTMPQAQFEARRKPDVVIYDFSRFDQLIDQAASRGIRIHLSLTGPAPRWANARKAMPGGRAWFKPSARQFGEFASVVAEHFEGRVDRYSIWNEPNWKTWLGPLKAAPNLYRGLYLRAYRAIKAADRGADVLIGETAPYSRRGFSTSPLAFLRKVTCVNKRYRRARRCPKLRADGYAHHPYDFAHSPRYRYPGSDNVTIGTLSRLTRALDRIARTGQLRKNGRGRMPVHLTEYGYFASGHRAIPKRKRSRYLQQAYSIALRNKRVKSQLQYLLVSPPRTQRASFFDLGLVSQRGKRNVSYRALQRWYRRNRRKVKRPGRAFSLPAARPAPSR